MDLPEPFKLLFSTKIILVVGGQFCKIFSISSSISEYFFSPESIFESKFCIITNLFSDRKGTVETTDVRYGISIDE